MGRGIQLFVAIATAVLAGIGSSPAGAGVADEIRGDEVAIPVIRDASRWAEDRPLSGYLFKPGGSGPFPAVVLLHGCSGLEQATPRKATFELLSGYARRYNQQGYVALILDSFTSRDVVFVCNDGQRIPAERRALDALSAARFLGALGYVDRDRIVLQGLSHGGSTVLEALRKGKWTVPEHFAAGIAWYPRCQPALSGYGAPLLILIGDADDWTPARRCTVMLDSLPPGNNSAEVVVKIYPDAHHAFDYPYPERVRFGHKMAYDQGATEDAWRQIDTFLDSRIAR